LQKTRNRPAPSTTATETLLPLFSHSSSYNFHTVITDMSTGADVTAQATGATTQAFTGSVG
jgi:hypothetical protein